MNAKNETDRLEEALLTALKKPTSFEPSPMWQSNLMREIRLLDAEMHEEAEGFGWLAFFDRIVWRMAPAMATASVLLFAASLFIRFSGGDMTKAVLSNPAYFLVLKTTMGG